VRAAYEKLLTDLLRVLVLTTDYRAEQRHPLAREARGADFRQFC